MAKGQPALAHPAPARTVQNSSLSSLLPVDGALCWNSSSVETPFPQHLRIHKRDQRVCSARCFLHGQATVHIKVLLIVLMLLEFREFNFQSFPSFPNPYCLLSLINCLLLFRWTHSRPRCLCFLGDSFLHSFNTFGFFIFGDRVSLCHPGWSAVAQSRLTTAQNSWAQAILPPQPPEKLGLQARAIVPG